jgi:hypothetical protein
MSEGFRVVGLWDAEEYDQAYEILGKVHHEKYLWSALQHRREDGQAGRSVLIYDLDLAEQVAQIGVAHIFYRIRVGRMPLEEHREIGKLIFKDKIPVHVSTSYAVDKSINNAVWEIADKDIAMFVKLKWGES